MSKLIFFLLRGQQSKPLLAHNALLLIDCKMKITSIVDRRNISVFVLQVQIGTLKFNVVQTMLFWSKHSKIVTPWKTCRLERIARGAQTASLSHLDHFSVVIKVKIIVCKTILSVSHSLPNSISITNTLSISHLDLLSQHIPSMYKPFSHLCPYNTSDTFLPLAAQHLPLNPPLLSSPFLPAFSTISTFPHFPPLLCRLFLPLFPSSVSSSHHITSYHFADSPPRSDRTPFLLLHAKPSEIIT